MSEVVEVQEQDRPQSMAEWVTKMSLLGATNRDAYRALRAVMWQFVVENSARSDFPSKMS
jgi:hypothetical protein